MALVQTRPHAKNRVHTVREETNIQRSSVVTELLGNSGRQMRAALIAGERDPQRLSALALGRVRHKLPQLALALAGQCTVHPGRLIQGALDLMALLAQQSADLDQHMGALGTPLQPQLAQLDSIPGVDRMAAREIIAEIGVEMRRCGSAGRLAAWARVSPGNNDSAGKRRSGRTGTGHRYVRRLVVQCAWAARKTPTFLGRTFRRLDGRWGKKKAAVAIAQKMLVRVSHLLTEGTYYDEQRSAHLHPHQENRWQRHAVETLERLGSRVVLEKIAEKPGDAHHRAPSRWECFCSGHAPETAKRGVVCLFGRRYFMGNAFSV